MPRDLLIAAFAPAVWGSTYLVTTEFLPPDAPCSPRPCGRCRSACC